MKLRDVYESFIRRGIAADPRGPAEVLRLLAERAEKYAQLKADEQARFDREALTNPYADTRILFGAGDEEVRSLLVGIDIETGEMVLADRLRQTGRRIDAVLTHHPEGHAYARFYEVMGMQADILHGQGLPVTAAEDLTASRMKEVGRKVSGANHARAVDAARLLNIPFLAAHTVADNHVAGFLQNRFTMASPRTLKDVVEILRAEPEYRAAEELGAGPCIIAGAPESRCGRVFVDMTGGTEGPREALEGLARAGVGTMVCMHMSEDHFKACEQHHIHVVIAGHIASDNLGLNVLLDQTESELGHVDIIECSGFRRFSRT